MDKRLKILFNEDVKRDAELIWRELESNEIQFEKLLVDNKVDFIEGLESFLPDIIISDYSLPQFDGMEALLLRNKSNPLTPFILVTGSINEEVAVECIKAGADDYILKENLSRLVPAINNSLKKFQVIIEKKKIEEELRESYLFNESLLKSIPFGMDIVDEDGNILFLSDNFIRLFGEEAIGRKCWELYRDDKTQCEGCPLISGINVGETESYESHGVLGNRIFEINHTGMLYQGKKSMLEIFQDITDRKNNEKELIYAKEKAEEGDRLKTAFLHNISHEIRTPMNAIVGFSAMLNEPDIDENTRMSYAEILEKSSNQLLSIVTDIVDISNIEARIVKINKKEININGLIKSLYGQYLHPAAEKNIRLEYESELSDSEELIITDGLKLTQIISNLIDNALKFTERGTIKVTCKLKNNKLEFCVADTGIGISEEHQSKIFDRFYQVQDSTTRVNEGTGLGLSISKGYVKLLGGKIWLSSKPGTGTQFFFTIPNDKKLPNIVIPENEAIEELQFKDRKTILIAEDIESNYKLLTYFLAGLNIEIIKAENGKEAVEKCLADKNIDLILMDIKMPIMDGYAATNTIRKSLPDIPIIAQTAYSDDVARVNLSGFNSFISKPFTKAQLLSAINTYLK